LPSGADSRQLAYNKGFFVWEMLSREIGLTSFRAILARIGKEWKFRKIGLSELLKEIETRAGKDLQWFYKQWFD
jgi:aminopeptidase N